MRARGSVTAMGGIVTASLALLCLVAELGTVAHVVLVRHAVCPEHGEVVHRSASAAPSAHRAPLVSPAARSLPAHDGADAHEHCGLAASRTPHSSLREVSRTAPHLDGTEGRPPRSVDALPAIALIRVAPKSSPPV